MLCQNKKIAILAQTPTLNLTQILALSSNPNVRPNPNSKSNPNPNNNLKNGKE